MAEELPDFPTMAGKETDLGQLRHQADWASTFGPGTTNLARRRGYRDDVMDFNAELQKRHEQELMKDISTGKNAFNFWKATQDMALKEELHAQDMKFKAPLVQAQINAARTKAILDNQKLLNGARKAEHDARVAIAEETDKAKFTELQSAAMDQFGYGTPEYNKAILKAHAETPGAPWAGFKGPHVTGSMKMLDPALIEKNEAEIQKHVAETIKQERLTKQADKQALQSDQKIVNDLKLKRASLKTGIGGKLQGEDITKAALLDEMIAEAETRRAPAQPTAQQAPTRPIFKDANGKRAYKNPDGTFEPIP
jgi:hypothetical protein